MEPNNFNPYQQSQQFHYKPSNLFESASWILGFVALASSLFIYGAYLFGAMSILFALLSRGGQMHFSNKAKHSLMLGAAAIVISTVLFVGAFYTLLQEYGSFENLLREASTLSGIDYETEIAPLFQ